MAEFGTPIVLSSCAFALDQPETGVLPVVVKTGPSLSSPIGGRP